MLKKEEIIESRSRIQITSGREVYAPIPFHTFEVGPVSVDIEIEPGETMEAAFERGQQFTSAAIEKQFEEKLVGFFNRIGRLDEYMMERGMATRAQSNSVRPTSSRPAPVQEDHGPANEAGFKGDPSVGDPANERQFQLLRKLADAKNVDVDSECERIFGIGLDQISKPAMSKFLDWVNAKPSVPVLAPEPSEQRELASAQDPPVSQNSRDQLSAKQLQMIRSISREKSVDADKLCQEKFNCSVSELNKKGASELIDHLVGMPVPENEPVTLSPKSDESDYPF